MKTNKLNKKNAKWEGFDDCPICRAMKNGTADTMNGLMNAFREAEKSGIGITKILKDEYKSK